MYSNITNPVSTLSLHPAWSLDVVNERAYVSRLSDGTKVAALSAPEAVAVGLMNSRRTTADIKALMKTIAPADGGIALDQVLSRLEPLLSLDTKVQTQPSVSLSLLASVLPPESASGIRSLPGPKILHWWVTSVCPKRCAYCFADPIHGGKADDALLSFGTLERIFRESASLGADQLLVAGGEPLLRRDLPQVLASAISYGIEPGITTKHSINNELAAALADGGLKHICLSIDSTSESVNRVLIGATDHAAQTARSARNLAKHGVDFSFECVLTPFNIDGLEGVVSMASELGARKVLVVPYESVRSPIGLLSNQDMVLSDELDLMSKLDRLRRQYPNVELEKFEMLAARVDDTANCDIGITKLLFNAKGQVHRCYKLISDETLTGADLKEVSVARAWHDPEFAKIINPPRSKYADSACGGCSDFSNCHSEGRCIYQSLVDNSTYYAIDRRCGNRA